MDVFTLNISFDPATGVNSANGSNVKTNTPDTTLGSTVRYVIDSTGVARSPQGQERATNLGLNSVAPFEGATAVGSGAAAKALGCTALGTNSVAKVVSSVAVGDQAQALSYRSIAIGRCANATAENAIAIGTQAEADVRYAIALGVSSKGSGQGGVAIGTNSQATIDNAIAIGLSAQATGTSAIAIGAGTVSAYVDSIALGVGSVPTGNNQFVAGSPSPAGHTDVWFGQGNQVAVQGGTIAGYTIHGEESRGTSNSIGGDLKLTGGQSTGTGKGGALRLQASSSGSSGSSLNSLFDRIVVAARKALTNNTTTELFRIAMPNPSSLAFEVKLGLSITDGTNAVSYIESSYVAAIHDGSGYLSTITSIGASTQLGGGGSALAVTVSMTQPAANVMAFCVNSNTTGITPTSTLCFIEVIVNGENIVSLQ